MRHAFIKKIFSQFTPPSHRGHMDLTGLKQFLNEYPQQAGMSIGFEEKDAKRIMKSFDEDKNGTLEESEFVHWIRDGLDQKYEDRVAYAKASALGGKLVSLIDAVRSVYETKSGGKSITATGLNSEGKADDPPVFDPVFESAVSTTPPQCDTYIPDEHAQFVSRFAAHHNISTHDILFCDTVTQLKKKKENVRIVVVTKNALATFVVGENYNAHKKSKSVPVSECLSVRHSPNDTQVVLKVL